MLKHLFFILTISFTSWIVGQTTPGSSPTSSPTEIDQLITALDADKFLTREAATQDLANLGPRALSPVSNHFFNATTESAWRVKRVLTQIGTDAVDELTSLKAIGILLILDNQLDSDLESLIETWKVNRSKRATEHLLAKGAELQENVQIVGVQRQLFFSSQGGLTGSNPLRSIKRPRRLDPQKAKSQIRDLVSGDLDSVQKFVFQRLPSAGYAAGTGGDLVNQQVQNQVLRALNQQPFNGNRKVLEFGTAWTGSSTDFQRLEEIHDLSAIRFDGQTLSREDLKVVANLESLQHFSAARTKVRRGHLYDIELPRSVTSIELADQDLENETFKWLANYRLSELTLDNCRIPPAINDSISKMSDLEILNLRRTNISPGLFSALNKNTSLRRIVVSLCKFDINEYRRFVASSRPRLISFDPVSFLGVQGTRNITRPGDYTCEIELVVDGSGADKAGITAGDIVESVNGQDVQSFDDLRMFISQHDVGESMKVKITRGPEKLDLTVTLGENPNPRIQR